MSAPTRQTPPLYMGWWRPRANLIMVAVKHQGNMKVSNRPLAPTLAQASCVGESAANC